MLSFKSVPDIKLELASKIKRLRLDNEWTRAELARRSGVNINTLTRFERTGEISLSRFLQLSQILGRLGEFENLLNPAPYKTMAQALKAQRPKRQRGRRKNTNAK